MSEFSKKSPGVYGYIRVSTKGQAKDGNSIEEQQHKILEMYPTAVCTVEAASGAKDRELFNKLLESLQEYDLLVVTKLDRFCRTAREGLAYIDNLLNRNVRIHILNMGLIENSAIGRLIVTNLLAFAEFERSQIIERTQSGKAIAKQNPNYVDGRPHKYTKQQIELALKLKENYSFKQVEDMTGISVSTLYRAAKKRS